MDVKNSRNGSPSRGNYRGGNDQSDPDASCQLYVASLPHRYSKEDLLDLFKNYNVTNARTVTMRNWTYGFITLSSPEKAKRVIMEMNFFQVEEGRYLMVKFAKSQFQSQSGDGGQRQSYSEGRRTPGNGDGYLSGTLRAQPPHDQRDNCEVNDDYDDMPPLAPLYPVEPDQNGVRPIETPTTPGSALRATGNKQGAHYTDAVRTNENPDDYFDMPSLAPLSLSGVNKLDAMPSPAGTNQGFHRNLEEEYENKYSLIVGNIPEGASEFEVMQIFAQYQPCSCLIILDRCMPRFKQGTLALVYFGHKNHAAIAASQLDGTVHCGRTIRVWRFL